MLLKEDIDIWLDETAWARLYWDAIYYRAEELKADGCTGVLDLWVYT
jgi:hypothetical protein